MERLKLLHKTKNYFPTGLRDWLVAHFDFSSYINYVDERANPYFHDPDEVLYKESKIKAGIVFNRKQYHKYWIAACRDLKVSYRIIYLENTDWMGQVRDSDCDLFLAWPDGWNVPIKTMQDERLRIMADEMNKKLYPALKEIWLYENKRVQYYWLKAHGFPVLKTWIFYDLGETLAFLETASYPLVFKSNLGARSSGVYIIANKREARAKAKSFLKKGYRLKDNKTRYRQKGSLYIQEYLDSAKEWRMVRIGDSYFGHGKEKGDRFHSGSKKINWDLPPEEAFALLHQITEKGRFTSMNIDMFEAGNGKLYVNEMQTVFGTKIAKDQLKIKETPGRMIRDTKGGCHFEAGRFCKNHLCNLRLEHLLNAYH